MKGFCLNLVEIHYVRRAAYRKGSIKQLTKYLKFHADFGVVSTVWNEELHNLYSSPSIIRMIKSRRMRWAGHVARFGRRGMLIGYWWESQKERDDREDHDVDGSTILKWILER
jgi:hypothetical protein